MGNTFHHTAVATEYISEVIHYRITFLVELCCKMSFCHSHTNCHSHTCAKRAGSSFNTLGVLVFRMSRGKGIQLTELHQVFLGQTVSEQVKQRVQKHGTMSTGQDETVTVEPVRVSRIVLHFFCPQSVSGISCAERKSRMTGFCLLDCVCRENADSVSRHFVDIAHNFLHFLRTIWILGLILRNAIPEGILSFEEKQALTNVIFCCTSFKTVTFSTQFLSLKIVT